jgi:hypothetical protein
VRCITLSPDIDKPLVSTATRASCMLTPTAAHKAAVAGKVLSRAVSTWSF